MMLHFSRRERDGSFSVLRLAILANANGEFVGLLIVQDLQSAGGARTCAAEKERGDETFFDENKLFGVGWIHAVGNSMALAGKTGVPENRQSSQSSCSSIESESLWKCNWPRS